MVENAVFQICNTVLSEPSSVIRRCSEGIGNYVFYVECLNKKYIVRCSAEMDAYQQTIPILKKLKDLLIPVPDVIANGRVEGYNYLLLTYMEGQDLGFVYPLLTDTDKKNIAKEIVRIQEKVAMFSLEGIPHDWSWTTFVQELLSRARKRILENGYFCAEKVDMVQQKGAELEEYFSSIKPIAYLDDISSKNLLIHNGRISGIIDVDWIGIGDKLTYVALTYMALLNLEYRTDYVEYILEEMKPTSIQMKAFLFYTLVYCVDFMGERGMTFMDKRVDVDPYIIERLNSIFNQLWDELAKY